MTSLRPLRRTAVAVTALLAFVLLAGTTYQGVATALERHRFARPGGLVDAGGHQLHIYCTGKGSPIVVLEAAAGSMSAAWGWIQPEVARTTRVCSYDRAGLGWSEAGDGLYVASRAPEELRVLLDRANETGPVVLVGHELGALFARLYAARFEGSTAALVLIDDPIEGRGPVAPAFPSAWPWLARVGAVRTSGRLPALATGLPGDAGGAMRAFLNRPDHLTRAAMEIVIPRRRRTCGSRAVSVVEDHRHDRLNRCSGPTSDAGGSGGCGAGHPGDRGDVSTGTRGRSQRRNRQVVPWR